MAREKMTRKELTREIAKRVKDIRELYYSVYPEGDCLYIAIYKDLIDFNNKYHEEDKDYPINYFEDKNCIGINGVWEDK